jgi:hypothetical protein
VNRKKETTDTPKVTNLADVRNADAGVDQFAQQWKANMTVEDEAKAFDQAVDGGAR